MDGSWIDVRMLHKELKVGKDFTNWIKGRIKNMNLLKMMIISFARQNGGAKITW